MRAAGRFVVDTHGHITTLYQPATGVWRVEWDGLSGEVEPYYNTALTLLRHGAVRDRHAAAQAEHDRHHQRVAGQARRAYPDKFRAFCADQTLKLKVARGEAVWSLEAAAEEVEAALKTGDYIGIGEFVPRDTSPDKVYTFKERLDEYRVFAELARRYKVTMDFHDFAWHLGFDYFDLLARVAIEFPDVPIIFNHAGYSIGGYARGPELVRRACEIAGLAVGIGASNVYLECGTWPAEYFEFAPETPTSPSPSCCGGPTTATSAVPVMHPGRRPFHLHDGHEALAAHPGVPARLVGLDAAPDRQAARQAHPGRDQPDPGRQRGTDLGPPVPRERMFMCGRPDIWGVHWEQSIEVEVTAASRHGAKGTAQATD